MKLKELVGRYMHSSYDKSEAIVYISSKKIDSEIPEQILAFIKKFNGNELIEEQDFLTFSNELSTLNAEVKNCIIHLLYDISFNKYKENEEEIESSVSNIERNIKEGREISKSGGKDALRYIGLLNCYQLFAHHLSVNEGCHYFSYPGITPYMQQLISHEIPFAINALRLVGKLPTTDNFNGVDLSKPFYPLHLNVVKNKKVSIRKGIKESDDYFPYKMVSKLAKGDTGDNTFVATNGKKILFVRGVERYSPNAILASKIATLISADHFSSERLLDNRLVGSRAIPGYAVSVADHRTRNSRKQYIEVEKRIFPGSGIIDEVTNFVGESDANIENFGFSSRDVYQSHLTKIDFDHCNVTSEITKKDYESNILTRPYGGIYHNAPHIQDDPAYIKEKLFARLKLAMLPKALLSSLASKAFAPEDDRKRDKAIEECTSRSNIALELFFEHPQVDYFLHEDPRILNQCYQQIARYISTHFDDEDQELLQRALRERVEGIQREIDKKIGIELSLADYKPEIVEIVSLEEHLLVEQYDEPSVSVEQKNNKTIPETPVSESTWLSRNWLKLLGITLLSLIGIGVGLALTATGVLAPLGVGVVGLTVGAAVGFATGLAVGGATFGVKIAYDEQQYRTSHPVNEPNLEDALRPSSSVENLIEQVEVTRQRLDKGIASAENELVRVYIKPKVQIQQEREHILSSNFENRGN